MTELPAAWATAPLATIADVQLGRQRSPQNHTGPNMRPYLRAANVTWNGLALDDIKKMHFSPAEVATFRLVPGDILLSEASGSASEVGKPAIWQGEIDDCCFQNTLLRVRSEHLEPRYLFWFFKWLALSGQFARGSRGVGIHHLGAKALSEWNVPIAPADEQKRVVAAIDEQFSRLDAATAGLERARRNLWGMRATALDGLLRDPDGTDVPFVELGEILLRGRYGTSTKCSIHGEGLPVLRIPNVKSGKINLSDLKYAIDTSVDLTGSLVADGDILIIRTNGSRSLIGRAAVASMLPQPTAFASYLIQLRVNSDVINPSYLAAALDAPRMRAQIEDLAATSAGQYNISLDKLRSLRVPVPDLSKQTRVLLDAEDLLSTTDRMEAEVMRSLIRSGALRSAILARAFSGSLASQNTGDESAEMMLRRIMTAQLSADGQKGMRLPGRRERREQVTA